MTDLNQLRELAKLRDCVCVYLDEVEDVFSELERLRRLEAAVNAWHELYSDAHCAVSRRATEDLWRTVLRSAREVKP